MMDEITSLTAFANYMPGLWDIALIAFVCLVLLGLVLGAIVGLVLLVRHVWKQPRRWPLLLIPLAVGCGAAAVFIWAFELA